MWLSLTLRSQVALARPAALVMGVGVVQVAASGPAAAAGSCAGGVAGFDQVLEPVAVLGCGVLAGSADDGGEVGDVQKVQMALPAGRAVRG